MPQSTFTIDEQSLPTEPISVIFIESKTPDDSILSCYGQSVPPVVELRLKGHLPFFTTLDSHYNLLRLFNNGTLSLNSSAETAISLSFATIMSHYNCLMIHPIHPWGNVNHHPIHMTRYSIKAKYTGNAQVYSPGE